MFALWEKQWNGESPLNNQTRYQVETFARFRNDNDIELPSPLAREQMVSSNSKKLIANGTPLDRLANLLPPNPTSVSFLLLTLEKKAILHSLSLKGWAKKTGKAKQFGENL